MRIFIFLTFLLNVGWLNAQTHGMSDSALIAMEKADQAFVMLDQGKEKMAQAISLMKEAVAWQPNRFEYQFQVGFFYFQAENYIEAAQYLEGLINHRDVTAQCFQLLGNTYFILKDPIKALSTFDVGLSKFPKSGLLYGEKGKHFKDLDEGKALFYFEKGIELDPNFAMNYYHAAEVYFRQSESIKAILHGEIFMLLDRTSSYSIAMSELLYSAYRKKITVNVQGELQTFFCSPNKADEVIDLSALRAYPSFCVAYASMVRETKMNLSVLSISHLAELRKQVLEIYYRRHLDVQYEEWAFDFQNYIYEAGHLEAYNHWLLMGGNELEFLQWKENNEDKWLAFTKWFAQHDMAIPE
jgi:hypothetical protein